MSSEAHTAVKSWDNGYLFPTAQAEASASAWTHQDPNDPWHVKMEAGKAEAGASLGSYTGIDANVTAFSYGHDNGQLKLGLGVDTGVGIKDGSLSVKVLGTGLTFGDTIGFSFLGSSIEGKNFFKGWFS